MANSAPLMLRLVSSSVCIANRAGRIIREIMQKGELGTVVKGKNDFQTEADRAAQRSIIASLYQKFPKISIFGEEETCPTEDVQKDWIEKGFDAEVLKHTLTEEMKAVKEEEIVVWVDPLDGTAEYTQGLLDHVTVLIGIAVKGRAVAGIIYQPYYNYKAGPDAKLGRCIWGIKGTGTSGLVRKRPPKNQRIITTSKWHLNSLTKQAINECSPSRIDKLGGAGYKVLLVIEGQAHAYVFASPGCKKWDTCAPEAVLHAAGGKLTDIHGNYYEYHPTVQRRNCGGVLAVPDAKKHDWYLNKISDEVKEALPVS